MRIFATVTDQGTAMAESALCGKHHADPQIRKFAERVAGEADDVARPLRWVDCTGNDQLRCIAE